ncbi:glycerol-3-phosphate 1-O-acyltransferase PlsY [Clostridium saccharobutylicum]|uniref:Glycerol-3-phosphate acyltransferase n=1 Tax=Clostridium saccharobutylicum DSM 13864 TaxID=1345695 RepID=U5MTW9_CLOSA|nr:glycerol-3-phosphate 1-O-acyltransferase PlsY [Clostridium saccharobutylicum]AGX43111.1 glycerol-3-phosphate acyltransferase PlsY [Clostridium saccharobutylicum DSM 13864]AQR90408.1 glycerol-3-phosphate acyltransferase [Clostridium saccharobutylicum]AQS00314.1 glycerol-3-phosphate acyltransferase [Clostridium saccharobutylicum]AQS14297.1 glycerol-3-phosphate acyltransferase [Clostridium saccharobutylicum]MBA2907022.1 glycerol-3-phosphate acyltransferase PlsY [Clostridium saccharobutylicum]
MIILITIIISFLCGSIPTGYLLTKKFCKIDIRTKGSGNIGSTNVKRIAGTKISIITQIIDILKGIVPVALGLYLIRTINLPISANAFIGIIAITVILGHNYTPFLKFNGGKGVNTTLGAFVLIAPIPTLTGVAVHFILRLFTSIVSIRSIAIGVTIPVMCIIMKSHVAIVISATVACILMIVRHKDNLIRIINNEEK